MKLCNKIKTAVLLLLLSFPLVSLGESSGSGPGIKNPLSGNGNLVQFINNIIDAAMKLGALVAVVAMIYAGFLFVTAQGDEGKIETAKKVLLYTAIGIAILLGARMLSDVIANTVTNVEKATN